MNLTPEANEIATTVAARFYRFLGQACPNWEVGFLRFALAESGSTVSASCVLGAQVAVVDHPGALDTFGDRAKAMFEAQGLGKGVVLFVVGASQSVELRFDLENLERWKLDDKTGLPAGM